MGNTRRAVLLVLLYIQISQAYIHPELTIKPDDRRAQFMIESFGFAIGGVMKMTLNSWEFKVAEGKTKPDLTNNVYFLIKNTMNEPTELVEQADYKCGDLYVEDHAVVIYPDILYTTTTDKTYTLLIKTKDDEGVRSLYFINCFHNNREYSVSFKLHLEQYNVDADGTKNYLPTGLSRIPTIYAMFAAVYAIMFFVWVFGYMRGQGTTLNKVHYLMSVLVILKFLSVLFYAIEQHQVKLTSGPGGWEFVYYIFTVLKTGFFFVIVTLIGTGWSFFKPFLSEKDKKLIMVVIPLQILDNVAMVVVETYAQGSVGWITWKDIFRLVDIICCGAILIPIIWSIKHLREASQSDGKAARNLQKLRLFRQFYLIVVSYIYFTRIIIYLLDATLQYPYVYMGHVFTELATLSFFLVVGYKFRPVQGNPYFNIEEEDAARLEEMHVGDED